ncbi:MAG: tRNA (adenosine(37)-N6)-threonylcarbamoyltransferase complex ATPase subunit type 1 TsaE [Hyphomicrobiaceae bacterium]
MPDTFTLENLDESALGRMAQVFAAFARKGDVFALVGDLGAGKTTFARAMIRALLGSPAEEIPSPTFTLVQTYTAKRMEIAHLDLYRLSSSEELDELGLDAQLANGIALIEWPQNAGDRLPADRIVIRIEETRGNQKDADRRDLTISGTGALAERAGRMRRILELLARDGWQHEGSRIEYLQGDASARAYAGMTMPDGERRVLMDWPRQPDGPPIRAGLPYSRIAHLAEDVRPFVAIANALAAAGIAAPRVLQSDLDAGLLVIEHLGDGVYGRALAEGASQRDLWSAALDVLLDLRRHDWSQPLPVGDGTLYRLPAYDAEAMDVEVSLLPDWLWSHAKGTPIPSEIRNEHQHLWAGLIRQLHGMPAGLVLRDYHSPNLIWRSERSGLQRVGVIDFQDALLGNEAYDVVSLLQDARLDVSEALERDLLKAYCAARQSQDRSFDEPAFHLAYAALGAQRASKILGIFARLNRRDGKPQYLAHLPRVSGYLARCLRHPALEPLAQFHKTHFAGIVGR